MDHAEHRPGHAVPDPEVAAEVREPLRYALLRLRPRSSRSGGAAASRSRPRFAPFTFAATR